MTGSPAKKTSVLHGKYPRMFFFRGSSQPRFVVEELGKDDDQLAGAALIAVRRSGGWKKTRGPLVMCDFGVVGWFGVTDVSGV